MILQLPVPETSAGAVAFGLAAAAGLVLANFSANRAGAKHPPRWVYVWLVVILFGAVIPAWALGVLRTRSVVGDVLAPAPAPIVVAIVIGLVLIALAARRQPGLAWRLAPKLWFAMIAPSLAEAVVFLGLVFGIARWSFAFAGGAVANLLAVIVSSCAFGLYHFTHRPPWNRWRIVAVLVVVWIAVSSVYVATGNLWAAAAFNACMATTGMVRNNVSFPARQSWPAILLSAVIAIAAVCLLA